MGAATRAFGSISTAAVRKVHERGGIIVASGAHSRYISLTRRSLPLTIKRKRPGVNLCSTFLNYPVDLGERIIALTNNRVGNDPMPREGGPRDENHCENDIRRKRAKFKRRYRIPRDAMGRICFRKDESEDER